MKKGYKRLLIFCSVLIIILCLSAFWNNILSGYRMIFFLLVLVVIFDSYFVLERDNKRYFKDLLFETFMFLMLFFIFFYLLGLVVGLARVPSYLTFNGIKNILLPIILFGILRELLRYNLLKKSDGNLICTVVVIVLMILFDLCDDYFVASFATKYSILSFIALVLLPTISRNLSYSYISKRYGYKIVIIYDLVFSLSFYLLPLIPNPNEYIMAIIYLVVPVLYAFRIYSFYMRRKDELIPRDYKKKKLKGIIVPVIIIMAMVYLYSGYFRFYAIAIASGSMEPKIHKGDLVIVDQDIPFENIEIGDVIAYRHEKIIVVHRVVKKIEYGDSYILYTQGDANEHMDDLVIEEDVVIGKVDFKIPYIGSPTVWFSEK